ncbi:unnamed protein product [Spirodela intermedia]|uniref:Uncharacterized protein n=1 Tax=Spirodela intermedia TaxID=51605 RepID=A0A7I8I7N9_SPIIN|nr:unnamed protein product [Spirodela intermedia]CAA6653600.1 unnamed protein product [Spirodela intermedia]
MEEHRAPEVARSLRGAIIVLLIVTALATVFLFLDDKHSTLHRLVELPLPASVPGFPFCFGDRMSIFLFCNVLLVLVSRNLSLVAPHGPGDEAGIAGKSSSGYQVVDREVGSGGGEKQEFEKRELEEMSEEEKLEEVQWKQNRMKGDEQEKVLQEEEQQQEEREEGDKVEGTNVDELNRRFEDFIEKVKTGMRMEALHLARI